MPFSVAIPDNTVITMWDVKSPFAALIPKTRPTTPNDKMNSEYIKINAVPVPALDSKEPRKIPPINQPKHDNKSHIDGK